ncbi:hypothetical protein [Phascolarctobacterium faecium]|uniref:hypothetical protein n=1 Tax=Phascolarctobacterium faecium TaxID=33025 RepID=UPI003AB23732
MAELAKKLYFKKAGIEQTAKAYSTTAEVGAEYIENKIDGVTCYVAIGDTTNSMATVGLVKKSSTAAERAILNSGKPPYAEMSWTTPGTYTWTAPAGVTRAYVALCGGGGGASVIRSDSGLGSSWVYVNANDGGSSSFGSLLTASGGTGGKTSGYCYYSSGKTHSSFKKTAGVGGSPNGNNGSAGECSFDEGYYDDGINGTINGANGFSLSFSNVVGSYGASNPLHLSIDYSLNTWGFHGATGGSGGYTSGYVDVTPGNTYAIIVGAGGTYAWSVGSYGYMVTASNGNSGFVLIAFGGDI